MTKNLFRKILSVLFEFVIVVEEEQVSPAQKQTIIHFARLKKDDDLIIKKEKNVNPL